MISDIRYGWSVISVASISLNQYPTKLNFGVRLPWIINAIILKLCLVYVWQDLYLKRRYFFSLLIWIGMYIFSAKWDWQKRTRKAHGRTSTTSLWVRLFLFSICFKNSSKLLGGNGVSPYCTSRFFLSPLLVSRGLVSLLWRRRKSSPFSSPESKSRKVCIQRPLTKIQGGAIFHMQDIRRNVLPKFIGALYGDALLLHCSDLTEL